MLRELELVYAQPLCRARLSPAHHMSFWPSLLCRLSTAPVPLARQAALDVRSALLNSAVLMHSCISSLLLR